MLDTINNSMILLIPVSIEKGVQKAEPSTSQQLRTLVSAEMPIEDLPCMHARGFPRPAARGSHNHIAQALFHSGQ